MIVSFLSQKGGVGKSTLAQNLAVAAAAHGWRVLIADLDPLQGTSARWSGRRAELPGERADVEARKAHSTWGITSAARSYDLVVVDGPAHAIGELLSVAHHSELVVLPADMSFADLEPQVEFAHELLEGGVPADRLRVAFCRVQASETERARVRGWLARAGIGAFERELRRMPAVRLAQNAGLAACEARPPTVRAEAQALATEMLERLGEPAL